MVRGWLRDFTRQCAYSCQLIRDLLDQRTRHRFAYPNAARFKCTVMGIAPFVMGVISHESEDFSFRPSLETRSTPLCVQPAALQTVPVAAFTRGGEGHVSF